MQMIHFHFGPCVQAAKFDRAIALLEDVLRKVTTIMTKLEDLQSQVEANTQVEASAVVLINGIAAQLAAAKTDPVAIQALSDHLKTSATDLAAAVTANTPAEPAA